MCTNVFTSNLKRGLSVYIILILPILFLLFIRPLALVTNISITININKLSNSPHLLSINVERIDWSFATHPSLHSSTFNLISFSYISSIFTIPFRLVSWGLECAETWIGNLLFIISMLLLFDLEMVFQSLV